MSLSTLHTHRDLNLILMGEGNLARLVPAGRSLIRPLREVEGPSCGLVPTAGRAITSTRWVLLAPGRCGCAALGCLHARPTTACVGCPPLRLAGHLPAGRPAHTLAFQRCLLHRGLRYNMDGRETPWRQPPLHRRAQSNNLLHCVLSSVQGAAVQHGAHGDAVWWPGQQQQCDRGGRNRGAALARVAACVPASGDGAEGRLQNVSIAGVLCNWSPPVPWIQPANPCLPLLRPGGG